MAKALLTHKTIEALKPLPGHRAELFDSKVTGLSVRVTEKGTKSYGYRSDIYNSINNLQAHYRWYVTHCL